MHSRSKLNIKAQNCIRPVLVHLSTNDDGQLTATRHLRAPQSHNIVLKWVLAVYNIRLAPFGHMQATNRLDICAEYNNGTYRNYLVSAKGASSSS